MLEDRMTLATMVHLEARPGRDPHTGTSLLSSTRGPDTSPSRRPGMTPARATRRRLLPRLVRGLSVTVLLALLLVSSPPAAAARPSIVLVMTDDQEAALVDHM